MIVKKGWLTISWAALATVSPLSLEHLPTMPNLELGEV